MLCGAITRSVVCCKESVLAVDQQNLKTGIDTGDGDIVTEWSRAVFSVGITTVEMNIASLRLILKLWPEFGGSRGLADEGSAL